jgi:prepilin-type N-terminal cleavage/methylation domain-containing protein
MRNRRHGFTLVEMLVAMALTLFVMAILSQAFVTALETFSGLKAIGDMQQSLRVAMTNLRTDLSQAHFEGARKLSDSWSGPPKQGYFFLRHGSTVQPKPANPPFPNYMIEGDDADNLRSFKALDHVLAFTIRLRGNRRENYMISADIPYKPGAPPEISPLSKDTTNFWGQPRDGLFNPIDPANLQDPDTYASQWAEIAYFLWQTGVTEEGVPLYGLYRAQYLLVPNAQDANNETNTMTANDWLLKNSRYLGISCHPGPGASPKLVFNSPEDVADPEASTIPGFTTKGQERRVLNQLARLTIPLPLSGTNVPAGTQSGRPPRSATLVVPNIVSFQIQGLVGGAFADVGGNGTYETSATNNSLSAIQIVIRVHHPDSGLSRQITFVQDL